MTTHRIIRRKLRVRLVRRSLLLLVSMAVLLGACSTSSNAAKGNLTSNPTALGQSQLVHVSLAYDGNAEVLFGGLFDPSSKTASVSSQTWTNSTSKGAWNLVKYTQRHPWQGTLVYPNAGAYDESIRRLVAVSTVTARFTTWTFHDNVWEPYPSGTLRASTQYFHPIDVVYANSVGSDVLVACTIRSATNITMTMWKLATDGWTPIPSSGKIPSCSDNLSMTYDNSGKAIVAYYLGRSWEWENGVWKTISTSNPIPIMASITSNTLAYDPLTRQDILFGMNLRASVPTAQTWVLRRNSWVNLHPRNSPPPSFNSAIAFDPSINKVVLMGGITLRGSGVGQWDWNGSNWMQVLR